MAELQEALDENGKPTGERLTKTEIFGRGLWRPVCHVWLVNSNQEMLIQKRAKRGIFDHKWDVTMGGGMNPDEDPADAAIRELSEELGIVALQTDLRYIKRYKLPKIIPETGQQMNDFSHTFALFRDFEVSEVYPNPKEVALVRGMRLVEVVRRTADPTLGRQWVPHGPEYYADVTQRIMSLAA